MRKRTQHVNKQFLQDVGEAIRTRRVDMLLSQQELADRCRVHRTYITEIENGMRNIGLMTLFNIARGLGVEPWKLLIFTAEPNS